MEQWYYWKFFYKLSLEFSHDGHPKLDYTPTSLCECEEFIVLLLIFNKKL